MKTNKFLSIVIITAMLLALVPAGIASAAMTKVAVCHLDDMGVYHLINIAEAAFPAHVEHGDASPGEAVPGKTGYNFAADCSLVLNVSGNWEGYSGVINNLIFHFTMTLAQDAAGNITGSIVYSGPYFNGTRVVTGTLVGTTLSLHTADASYWANVSGTASGTHFYGEGNDISHNYTYVGLDANRVP